MNIEQIRTYFTALMCDYNLWAIRAVNKTTAVAEKRFGQAKSELLGAVTVAKLMGLDVKIKYAEPTHYYSSITLVSVH